MVNVSEGRDRAVLSTLADAAGPALLDLHADPHHHRSVYTLAGSGPAVEEAARQLTAAAVARLNLRRHRGAHPRFGVVDVVPFVAPPTGAGPPGPLAVAAGQRFAHWVADVLELPVFRYGPTARGEPGRSLPEVRRHAFGDLRPDLGPPDPHPSAGAVAVGARGVLVAYNVWVAGGDLRVARQVAVSVRGPAVRALGLALGPRLQISTNLVAPFEVGPEAAYDRIARALSAARARADGGELVGLLPSAVLEAAPPERWPELGLGPMDTLEARLGDPEIRRQ